MYVCPNIFSRQKIISWWWITKTRSIAKFASFQNSISSSRKKHRQFLLSNKPRPKPEPSPNPNATLPSKTMVILIFLGKCHWGLRVGSGSQHHIWNLIGTSSSNQSSFTFVPFFFFGFRNPKFFRNNPARWAPTSYKWSYNPYKWPYNWVTGVITL